MWNVAHYRICRLIDVDFLDSERKDKGKKADISF